MEATAGAAASGPRRVPPLGSLSAALTGPALTRARLAHSAEAVPGALPDARALFDVDTLALALASSNRAGRALAGAEIEAAIASGESLVVRDAARSGACLGALADEAMTVLGGIARVELRVTPPRGHIHGWPGEVDDLLVVQTRGEAEYSFRHDPQGSRARGPFGLGSLESQRSSLSRCALTEGDVLYLPCGWWYVARSLSSAWSIAIAVSPL